MQLKELAVRITVLFLEHIHAMPASFPLRDLCALRLESVKALGDLVALDKQLGHVGACQCPACVVDKKQGPRPRDDLIRAPDTADGVDGTRKSPGALDSGNKHSIILLIEII